MLKRKDDLPLDRVLALLERHWKLLTIVAWLTFCAWFTYTSWWSITHFNLGDTDDNMRMMQVRALLHGQGWYDLRQYRLNPPYGANIHWTRFVDLPIAGIILATQPFVGGPKAQLIAAGLAPMLPYGLLLFGVALTARRLIEPRAFILPVVAMILAGLTNSMFQPERIDHHGWQLALLSLSVAGLSDPKRIRGGLTLGITTALSVAIGIEMIIYLAVAGAAVALFWIADPRERNRMGAYAVSLGGAVSLSFVVFASYANRADLCDALTPPWLSTLLVSSALLLVLAWLTPADWRIRLGLGAAAAAIVAAFYALMWPQCLSPLESVSPEETALWLSHVREARPVYTHGWQVASLILALPVTGAIGWTLLAWRNRADWDLFRRTVGAALMGLVATLLLFWQTRTGPAAQMMSVVGAVAIVWVMAPLFDRMRNPMLRSLGVVAVAVIGFGAAIPLAMKFVPGTKMTPREVQVEKANRLCNYIGSYRPIAEQPTGIVFTFIDLAPRLITLTDHNSIMGPYHRNGEQIVDSMKAFRGSADDAHRIFDKYHSTYLLTCPNSSTTTIFESETPNGFYAQLEKGKVPKWLTPVQLPADSPFRMWRIAP
jgi:hypothetical protein